MTEDYQIAKKQAEAAVKLAMKDGTSPYLPVLDEILEDKDSPGESYVGLLELPLNFVIGNKNSGRNNAFANNFMPLLDAGTEFSAKWIELCDSCREEGVREAIKCYEYMNDYYVLEGNKRVSVSNYLKFDYILAEVTRILPPQDDSKESRVYYEYLKFFDVTRAFYVTFSEPGGYDKLADLLGQDLEHPWPEQVLENLKAAYFLFAKLYRSVLKESNRRVVSDAFLLYLSLFPEKSLFEDSEDQIIKNIKMARVELLSSGRVDDIEFLDDTPVIEKKSVNILDIFNRIKTYSQQNPLMVGFVYDEEIGNSRWVESHEAGRLYAADIIGERVKMECYQASPDGSDTGEIIQKAIDDGNELIFTVSSKMAAITLQFAVANPNVKFLNCSIGQPHPSFRCYHGKLYEATFLTGILAADITLTESDGKKERRIGYLVHNVHSRTYANLNAFAIGVSLIDPECRISLKYTGAGEHADFRNEWIDEGVLLYADLEYSASHGAKYKSGLFRIRQEVELAGLPNTGPMPSPQALKEAVSDSVSAKTTGPLPNLSQAVYSNPDELIGAPYILWGKFYSMMIQSVLSGAWEAKEQVKQTAPMNYWFGLSTGVVGLRAPGLPYQTEKMLAFFKNAMVNGGMDPFSGELHSKEETIQEGAVGKTLRVPHELKKMTAGQIIDMDWLNDNIDGEMPLYIKP